MASKISNHPHISAVTSAQNAVFKSLLSSLDEKNEFILVHGAKLIEELAGRPMSGASNLKLKTLVARESFLASTKNSQKLQARTQLFEKHFDEQVTRISLSDVLFDQLDPVGVPDCLAAFEKPQIQTLSNLSDLKGASLIAATQNPLNLGTLARSASAFGIKNLLLLKEAASPFHPKSIRSSMGYIFDLSLFKGPSIKALKPTIDQEALRRLVIGDLQGTNLQDFQWPDNPLIFLGEEGQGVPAELSAGTTASNCINIQHLGHVDSLNAAVSGSILFYHYFTQTTC